MGKIKKLRNQISELKRIDGFKLEPAYTRRDERGWWMVTKQILIQSYINLYLNVFNGKKHRDKRLYFIDMLSSNGINKITKDNGQSIFYFVGSSIGAAIIANQKIKGFNKYFLNDYSLDNRRILAERFNTLNNYYNNTLNYEIDLERRKLDSNEWIDGVIEELKKDNYKHCLIIVDNEGMNINYNTIKKIREEIVYADLIINFQEQSMARDINRSSYSDSFINFFGCDAHKLCNKREQLLPLYKKQLEDIGYKLEPIRVFGQNFYYYLLFCHRKEVSGEWMTMIRKYREERFRNWDDISVKKFWDIIKGRQTTLLFPSFFTKDNLKK
ncbi:MAG: three-Cys-motif partner protein TcmP [Promethearchaeota archaeon]